MATKYNIYEIYIECIISGEVLDDLRLIVAFDREDAATYPFFHSVVMLDGTLGDDKFAVLNSGLPMTRAVRRSVRGE